MLQDKTCKRIKRTMTSISTYPKNELLHCRGCVCVCVSKPGANVENICFFFVKVWFIIKLDQAINYFHIWPANKTTEPPAASKDTENDSGCRFWSPKGQIKGTNRKTGQNKPKCDGRYLCILPTVASGLPYLSCLQPFGQLKISVVVFWKNLLSVKRCGTDVWVGVGLPGGRRGALT